jgi:4-hydroxy-3-polyprenylbenzoate decarboxylase
MKNKQIIVAVTGASGSIYAKHLIASLLEYRDQLDALALVFSDTAREIWQHELDLPFPEDSLVKTYDPKNFLAPFASGSSQFGTMIICPCSMGMLGRVASGVSDDLIARAADVMLKEQRRLILVPRETPFNLIHLQNMEKLTLSGAIVCPAIPSFYSLPASVEALVQTVVDRILDLAGLEINTRRWGE